MLVLICGSLRAGLLLTIAGELTRKLAMITAGSNFKHMVATRKQDDHQLVRSGIYRWESTHYLVCESA